jgi:hypothetical protein
VTDVTGKVVSLAFVEAARVRGCEVLSVILTAGAAPASKTRENFGGELALSGSRPFESELTPWVSARRNKQGDIQKVVSVAGTRHVRQKTIGRAALLLSIVTPHRVARTEK